MALSHDDGASRPIGLADTVIVFNTISYTVVSDSGADVDTSVERMNDAEGQADGSFGVTGLTTRKLTVQAPATEGTVLAAGHESDTYDGETWLVTKAGRAQEAAKQRFIEIDLVKKYN